MSRVAHACVMATLLWSAGACDNAAPTILQTALVTDTDVDTGPYQVRVVAYDDDGIGASRIAVRAEQQGAREHSQAVALAVTTEVQVGEPEGTRLVALLPGAAIGSTVTWSARVCDVRGACTTTKDFVFHVGAVPSAPAIVSVNPTEGPESGGSRVEIHGSDLRTGAVAHFDDVEAVHTEWLSRELIVATSPAHAVGTVDVSVTNTDGSRAQLPNAFTFTPSPLLLSVEPNLGPAQGGTAVVLRGARFFDDVRVLFDGAPCRALVHVSEAQLQCSTPPGAPGLVDVAVLSRVHGRSVLREAFMYVAAPQIDVVEPARGPDTGGADITIGGSGFQDGVEVFVDGVACTNVVVVSDSALSCTVPAGEAGVADVEVRNPDGQSDTLRGGFSYEGPPVVLQVDPALGPIAGGTLARVLGAGFRDNDVVRFGGLQVDVLDVVSQGELVVRVPPVPAPTTPAPASGLLRVAVSVQRQDAIDTRIGTLDEAFTYFWPPEVQRVEPARGPTTGGTDVIVRGRFFNSIDGQILDAQFDGVSCTNIVRTSSTALSCSTPAGDAGFADVRVQNQPQSFGIGVQAYFYVAPPRVDAIDPALGPTFGGDRVTVTGEFFQAGALVFVDGAPCTDVTFISAFALSCTTPAGDEGSADVRVLNPDAQDNTAAALYTYVGVVVVPEHGLRTGFTRVSVRAAGIDPDAVVRFDDAIADCTFVSSREVVCQTPPHGLGAVNVRFTNPNGLGEDADGAFRYGRLRQPQNRIDAPVSNCTHVELFDADGDGDLDLAASMGRVNNPETSLLFENDGTGTFDRSALVEATANSIESGDFDGDGDLDLVLSTTSGNGGFVLLQNDGGVFTDATADFPVGRGAFDAIFADLSGDARDDIYVLTDGCDVEIDAVEQPNCDPETFGRDGYFEAQAGGFVDRSGLAPHRAAWTHDHKVVATDLDGDGDLDLVVVVNNRTYTTEQNRILLNRIDEGEGFVSQEPDALQELVGDLYDLSAGDLDGDGDNDVVTTICAQVSGSGEVVLTNTAGELARNFTALPTDTADCDVGTLAHDVDDDGDLDVFFGGTRNNRFNLKLYVNRGDGTFADATSDVPSSQRRLQVNNIAAGDVDGDGDQDAVLAGGAPYSTPSEDGDVVLLLFGTQ